MTARVARRRRSTWLALAATVAMLAAAGVLTRAGVEALLDSRAGRRAEGQLDPRPTQRLPYTPTGLVATLDDAGRLTSAVVLAVEPDGTGGSIVQLAATADAGNGNRDVLRPLLGVAAVEGPESLLLAAEAMTGVAFDVAELVDQVRLAQIVAPLGDIPVQLPGDAYDLSSAEQWRAGDLVLPGPEVARLVTATDPAVDDWLFESARAAAWRGVADRVGAGIGSATPVASDAELPRPTSLDELLARLFAGPVTFRQLGSVLLDDDRVAGELAPEFAQAFGPGLPVGVVVHDRSEMLMVMGAVAPGRVGAPLEAPSFRVVSGFTADDLEAFGIRGSDLLKNAMIRLLFSRVNVVSVAELPGVAIPDRTTFRVADGGTLDGVAQRYRDVFGESIDVQVADTLIEGIDIELVLGRDFLEMVADELTANVAGLTDDGASTTDGATNDASTDAASSDG